MMHIGQHFDTFRDVYEALDACDYLEILLTRMREQGLLEQDEWQELVRQVASVRQQVEKQLQPPEQAPGG